MDHRRDWLRQAILEAGGFVQVHKTSGLSVSYLYNLCNGHKRLTADAVAALKPSVKVSDIRWFDDLINVSAQDSGATRGVSPSEVSADA